MSSASSGFPMYILCYYSVYDLVQQWTVLMILCELLLTEKSFIICLFSFCWLKTFCSELFNTGLNKMLNTPELESRFYTLLNNNILVVHTVVRWRIFKLKKADDIHKNTFWILMEKSIFTSCSWERATEMMLLLKKIVGERNWVSIGLWFCHQSRR